MTKRAKWILGLCAAVLIVGTLGFFAVRTYLDCLIVFPADGTVVIHWQQIGYSANNFTQTLSEENADKVKDILSRYHYDGSAIYGCCFNEDCTIAIGNTVFQLSQDGCLSVRNPQTDRYFQLSKADWLILDRIFAEYGGNI